MSESYSPDADALPSGSYNTTILSQRDVSLNVPINFVTQPGVSLSAACFPNLEFEDDDFGRCLSNLLAVGFRRYVLDIYWDQRKGSWSFCPVAAPRSTTTVSSSATVFSSATVARATASGSSSSASSTSPVATATNDLGSPTSSSSSLNSSPSLSGSSNSDSSSPASSSSDSSTSFIAARQETQTSSRTELSSSSTADVSSETSVASIITSTIGSDRPGASTVPDYPNGPFYSIGPYYCTTTVDLSTFTTQLLSYLDATENTIDAHLIYVDLNLHAAANDSDPLAPAPSPTALPSGSNLLSNAMTANLSTYIYSPSNLQSDRANLNRSWYEVNAISRPAGEYYSVSMNAYGAITTTDGWPTESYIEFYKAKRLLLGYGTVDPQLKNYNFTEDADTIFPSGYISANQSGITPSASGNIESGCFFQPGTLDLSSTNSSWTTVSTLPGFSYATTTNADLTPTLNLTTSLITCGISPILNVTLLNSTAQTNFSPYQSFSRAAIWSWAPDEPKNTSDLDFRCASLPTSHNASPHWSVSHCSNSNYAACRHPSQPHNWTLSPSTTPYYSAISSCPSPFVFSVPRTSLENTYLFSTIQTLSSHRDYDINTRVWIDYNSYSVEGCWTSGGINATCPYNENGVQQKVQEQEVIVPVVASVIVLVIGAVTWWAKGVGNRRARRRVRGKWAAQNGFVYEGVPS